MEEALIILVNGRKVSEHPRCQEVLHRKRYLEGIHTLSEVTEFSNLHALHGRNIKKTQLDQQFANINFKHKKGLKLVI